VGHGDFRRQIAEQHRRQVFPVDLKKPLVVHMYDRVLPSFAVELSDLSKGRLLQFPSWPVLSILCVVKE
jgi:hypothetical protein